MNAPDRRAVVVFLLLAFGSSWLIALPLWMGDGLGSPWFLPVAIGVMLTPAIAALTVVFLLERPTRPAHALGLLPLKPVRRLVGYLALAVLVPIALVLVALPVGSLIGVYPADFLGLSGYRQTLHGQLAAAGAPEPSLPVGVLVALQLVSLPLGAVVNLIPALGEELGWRGWLLPKLMPLGAVAATLISGLVWGLWHAPLILLGYNYPDAPGWLGLTMMVGMCVLVGAVFGWLRLRSASVWPAALAHGALNAAAGTYLLFAAAGERIDTTQATVLGWTGWIVPLVLVIGLLATGRLAPTSSEATPVEASSPHQPAGTSGGASPH